MPMQEMIATIQARAKGRFDFVSGCTDLMPVVSEPMQITEANVCRLRRNQAESGWRTILIAECNFSPEAIHSVYTWAADVRELLPEPETADLYMFLIAREIPDEEAARIETDDRFCRKVVLRGGELVTSLLDRTFLANAFQEADAGAIGDPLQTALSGLSDEHAWMHAYQKSWRELLLSGKSGVELADALMAVDGAGADAND